MSASVESRCGAVALGRTYLLPPLSFGGALLVRPCPRFHTPLIELDVQISRIQLSDKTSRLHPRHVAPKPAQAYEPKVPVKMREWIAPALATPGFVLELQPPAQPHRCVAVECPIRLADGAYLEVVPPSAQHRADTAPMMCAREVTRSLFVESNKAELRAARLREQVPVVGAAMNEEQVDDLCVEALRQLCASNDPIVAFGFRAEKRAAKAILRRLGIGPLAPDDDDALGKLGPG